MTKRELVDKIQELANYHLGHRGLNFDNYMRLTKAELEQRLEAAVRMHAIDVQINDLRSQHTECEWLHAAVFPMHHTPEMNDKLARLNQLCRQASDIWLGEV